MAQSNYTPIQLYRTSTATTAPTAGNLAAGELAINLTDEKLYFKNAAGTVKLLASNSGSEGSVTSVAVSGGTTGLTTSGGPITGSGTITLGGTLAIANGGTGATTAGAALTALGATTVGGNVFTLTNPSAITFPRFNANNTVSALSAADFRTAIGAGTGGGTVTSVAGTGTVNGITLTGTVTSSGSLTLGGTLSNVSLTTQVTGTLPVANGGTGAATFTANNVLLGNGTSALQVVAPSTNGNVLTSNGTTWTSAAPAGGGSWTFITSVTASSSATIDFPTQISATYDMYAMVAVNINMTGTTPREMAVRFTADNGSSYITSTYESGITGRPATGTGALYNSGLDGNSIWLTNANTMVQADGIFGASFVMYIPKLPDTARPTIFGQFQNGLANQTVFSGRYTSASAITGLRLITSSGSSDFRTGVFRLYGIKNS